MNNDKHVLIECQNLNKKYGKVEAIKDLNLNIFYGEHIGIIGPNGSGKTTLIEMICGIRKPNSGKLSYYFDKKNPTKKATEAELGRNIGVQFQESHYPLGLKVRDMLNFYLNLYEVKNKKEVLKFYIQTFNLEGLEKKGISRLSGGQQQRVNIALSIIHNPKIVILDEISTGLDIKARQDIKVLIKELAEKNGWTLILISHNMEEIEYLCDRVIYLRYGKITHDKSIKEVQQKYGKLQNFADENIYLDEKPRVIKFVASLKPK